MCFCILCSETHIFKLLFCFFWFCANHNNQNNHLDMYVKFREGEKTKEALGNESVDRSVRPTRCQIDMNSSLTGVPPLNALPRGRPEAILAENIDTTLSGLSASSCPTDRVVYSICLKERLGTLSLPLHYCPLKA